MPATSPDIFGFQTQWLVSNHTLVNVCARPTALLTSGRDRQIDERMDGRTDGQAGRQADRQTLTGRHRASEVVATNKLQQAIGFEPFRGDKSEKIRRVEKMCGG